MVVQDDGGGLELQQLVYPDYDILASSLGGLFKTRVGSNCRQNHPR